MRRQRAPTSGPDGQPSVAGGQVSAAQAAEVLHPRRLAARCKVAQDRGEPDRGEQRGARTAGCRAELCVLAQQRCVRRLELGQPPFQLSLPAVLPGVPPARRGRGWLHRGLVARPGCSTVTHRVGSSHGTEARRDDDVSAQQGWLSAVR